MRFDELPTSENIEDRRGQGAGFGMPGVGGGGLGIGALLVLGLLGWALGIDPRVLIGGAEIAGGSYQEPYPQTLESGTPNDRTGQFITRVLGSTEVQWKEIFAQSGREYRPPTLVLFSGATQSGCGFAQAATGPFYCPEDQKVYLDTSFFQDLERRFHACSVAACQFSQAYVIAHEVGHHVQNQLGVLSKAKQLQASLDKTQANRIQVRIELQADCLAGMWAHHAEEKWRILEPGDVESALQTASAIGDDRLQRQATGHVVPDAFTHGTSDQRTRWFTNGLKTGSIASCDTFGAPSI